MPINYDEVMQTALDPWLKMLGLNSGQLETVQSPNDVLLNSDAQTSWLSELASSLGQPLKLAPQDTAFRMPDLFNNLQRGAGTATKAAPIRQGGTTKIPQATFTPPVTSVGEELTTTSVATPTSATGGSKGVLQWKPQVEAASAKYGVPMDVIMGIMQIESGGNPKAESPMNYSGGKAIGTAKGLMQVLGGSFDPEANIDRGVEMLKNGFDRFGSWELAAAAYFGAIKQNEDGTWAVSDAKDVGGVSGTEYVRRFREAQSNYATPGG